MQDINLDVGEMTPLTP
jgi:ATPase subunit of ABC transporter with duplicated ATPase domains